MNKRKSARSWAVALQKKLTMIQWDLWQYRNNVLHSPTGPIAIASHHSLTYRISEELAKGTDIIAKSNTHLFSSFYSITKLQSWDIPSKILWLEMVCLAWIEYEEPDLTLLSSVRLSHSEPKCRNSCLPMDPLSLLLPGKDPLLFRTIQ